MKLLHVNSFLFFFLKQKISKYVSSYDRLLASIMINLRYNQPCLSRRLTVSERNFLFMSVTCTIYLNDFHHRINYFIWKLSCRLPNFLTTKLTVVDIQRQGRSKTSCEIYSHAPFHQSLCAVSRPLTDAYTPDTVL